MGTLGKLLVFQVLFPLYNGNAFIQGTDFVLGVSCSKNYMCKHSKELLTVVCKYCLKAFPFSFLTLANVFTIHWAVGSDCQWLCLIFINNVW